MIRWPSAFLNSSISPAISVSTVISPVTGVTMSS